MIPTHTRPVGRSAVFESRYVARRTVVARAASTDVKKVEPSATDDPAPARLRNLDELPCAHAALQVFSIMHPVFEGVPIHVWSEALACCTKDTSSFSIPPAYP
jgi:hypothetical protein